jgi:hypothetical protein
MKKITKKLSCFSVALCLVMMNSYAVAGATHRGRIQAQGTSPYVEKSEAWAQETPLTRSDGLEKLDRVWNSLSKAEKADRAGAYECAKNFINNAANAGGVSAQVQKPCKDRNRKDSSARIDIEVTTGVAFKP